MRAALEVPGMFTPAFIRARRTIAICVGDKDIVPLHGGMEAFGERYTLARAVHMSAGHFEAHAGLYSGLAIAYARHVRDVAEDAKTGSQK